MLDMRAIDERHVQNGSVLRVTEIISVQARGRDSRPSGFESRVVGDRNWIASFRIQFGKKKKGQRAGVLIEANERFCEPSRKAETGHRQFWSSITE